MSDKNEDIASLFTTLFHVVTYINKIMTVDELLLNLNDIILGVTGACNSTIVFKNPRSNQYEIKVSNLDNTQQEKMMWDLKAGFYNTLLTKPLFEKSVLASQLTEYDIYFSQRNVKTFISIPITIKEQTYGFILAEHNQTEALTPISFQFMTILINYVAISLNNIYLYEEIYNLAFYDALTNVYNRQYFNKKVTESFEKNEYLIGILLDIDYFKKVNDTYGHLVGDYVLKTMAELVKTNIEGYGEIYRFGGEEFIIILENQTKEGAELLAYSLKKEISDNIIKIDNYEFNITVSMGLTDSDNCHTLSNMIYYMDMALYIAKNTGRNRYIKYFDKNFYDEENGFVPKEKGFKKHV